MPRRPRAARHRLRVLAAGSRPGQALGNWKRISWPVIVASAPPRDVLCPASWGGRVATAADRRQGE
jgi:hypothetical protein